MLVLIVFVSYLKKRKILMKENFKGKEIPSGAGITLSMTWSIYLFKLYLDTSNTKWLIILVTIVSISIIGIIDDIFGDDKSKGFKGHIKRLINEREFSTGILKMMLIPGVVFLSSIMLKKDLVQSIFYTILGSMCVNLFNLFDLRPGRCIKVLWMFYVFIQLFGNVDFTITALLVLTLPFLIGDLREYYMLGDAGSNAIGYLSFIILTDGYIRSYHSSLVLIAFVIISVLNILSEYISFSKIIERSTILSFIDKLGRKN